MRELFGILEKIGPTGVTAIIEGETGTGKEVVANAIHRASDRENGPFIVFDCGAVPDNLIESELFGHEKGSFTGAIMTRQGLFEMAQGGTIFLDELGELNIDLQPKLLRVLEQREVRRVGSTKPIKVDVRVIAATNRNLEEEVKAGRFREDLFYRLSVVRIFLPPLRERLEDIPILVDAFLKNAAFNRLADGRQRATSMTGEAKESLTRYRWPGNVRELVNVVERACSFCDNGIIELKDLPSHVTGIQGAMATSSAVAAAISASTLGSSGSNNGRPFKEAKEEIVSNFEREYIRGLLEKNEFNISHAAREADIDRKYFRKLMRKYEIDQGVDELGDEDL